MLVCPPPPPPGRTWRLCLPTSPHRGPARTKEPPVPSLRPPTDTATTSTAPTPNRTIWRRRFWSLNSGRAISIAFTREQPVHHLSGGLNVGNTADNYVARVSRQPTLSIPERRCP